MQLDEIIFRDPKLKLIYAYFTTETTQEIRVFSFPESYRESIDKVTIEDTKGHMFHYLGNIEIGKIREEYWLKGEPYLHDLNIDESNDNINITKHFEEIKLQLIKLSHNCFPKFYIACAKNSNEHNVDFLLTNSKLICDGIEGNFISIDQCKFFENLPKEISDIHDWEFESYEKEGRYANVLVDCKDVFELVKKDEMKKNDVQKSISGCFFSFADEEDEEIDERATGKNNPPKRKRLDDDTNADEEDEEIDERATGKNNPPKRKRLDDDTNEEPSPKKRRFGL